MKNFLVILFFLAVILPTAKSQTSDSSKTSMSEKSVLDFTMNTIDGKPRPLSPTKEKC